MTPRHQTRPNGKAKTARLREDYQTENLELLRELKWLAESEPHKTLGELLVSLDIARERTIDGVRLYRLLVQEASE